ncbi:MAG: putative 4-hydroxy-2-ketovalerate aldolase [Eubacterium sp.]|jgi:4-hydroxy 2-oxovalerate aldolase|nr:putative 4-hydroxy-2-ketovalerate aldolase [Eubacterium sp.]
MSNIKILDCTLRDGGYINDWSFGERTIKNVIKKLSQSKVDIIECGFLTDEYFDKNKSLYNDVSKIRDYIKPKNPNTLYVGMIAYPEITIDKIAGFDGKSLDGIRVTFHEHEIDEALLLSRQLMEKGYKVFIQPVGTTSYTDSGLILLIKKVNELKPFAFYLVDTLGVMFKNDLMRLYYLVDNNLEKSIAIGFHSHNNLQLSFSNAQELIQLHTRREIIIDSSVFGMGRGAGNLSTELITQYINVNDKKRYNIEPLLEIVDEHIGQIFMQYQWGYSVPYYIAAINNCHPNYASYLINKQTISVKSINTILKKLSDSKKALFDKEYIEQLYIQYQKHLVDDSAALETIKNIVAKRHILIMCPGKSLKTETIKIEKYIQRNNPYIICVNFIPEYFRCDAIFFSNSKRFAACYEELGNLEGISVILTSNIHVEEQNTFVTMNYSDLLIEDGEISDNSGLMLINLLRRIEIKNVSIAGLDGYRADVRDNYYTQDIVNNSDVEELLNKNTAIKRYLNNVRNFISIKYITPSIYSENKLAFGELVEGL